MSTVEEAVAAIRGGELAIVPTDTVYGLVTDARREAAVRKLYRAKGRQDVQPTAVVAANLEILFECLPELDRRTAAIVRTLLPGALTLVVPNPAQRFRWLTGENPDAIGVRVPQLSGVGGDVLAGVEVMAATSANLPGGPDPRRLDEVPEPLLVAAAAAIDGGELAGKPSTVLDLTAAEPVVLREGAVPAADVLSRARSVV